MSDNLPQQYAEPAQMLSSTSSLVMDPQAMHNMMALADVMAKAVATVPVHFRGKPGDCLAVVMQAMQWGMNPYAIAQKTHLVSGTLGYEAQLVNAIIISRAPVKGRLQFEWFGDWTKIVGRFVERESKTKKDDEGNAQKFRMPGWDIKDEAGLGVRVWGTFRGEDEPRMLELLLTQARVRNSSLWADDPKQQLAYLATKKWSRLYCPDVIMGVYTPDELDERPAALPEGVERATAEDKKQAIDPNAAKRADLIATLEAAARTNGATLKAEFGKVSQADRSLLGTAEWERIKKLVVPTKTEDAKPSYAVLLDQINAAPDADALGVILGDITHLPAEQQAELMDAAKMRMEGM